MQGLVIVRIINDTVMYLKSAEPVKWTTDHSEAINCSPTDIGLGKARKYAEPVEGSVQFDPLDPEDEQRIKRIVEKRAINKRNREEY